MNSVSSQLSLRAVDLVRRALRRLKRELRALLPMRNVDQPVAALGGVAPPGQLDADARSAIEQARRELTTQISFLSHDLVEQRKTVDLEFDQRLKRLESTLGRLNELGLEANNKLSHLESSLHTKLNELGTAAFELSNKVLHLDSSLHTRLNDVLNVEFPRIHEQIHETTSLLADAIAQRGHLAASHHALAPRAEPVPFERLLEQAREDFPSVFHAWKERLDATEREMRATKVGNAAHASDPYSKLFRLFVERYADGPILDVGCGPYGKPFYLSSFDDTSIAGVDPLLFERPNSMQIVRGISEYLPWADGTFATVISATALDHCLSLKKSLDEMMRVLAPQGRALLWLGSNPGAAPFEPDSPDFKPADQYHLFHFDIAWFQPQLEQRFQVVDRIRFDRMQYSHVFYCLTRK